MRIIILLFVAWPLLATDSLTITETTGSTQTNYPVQIARPFVDGEITNCPQPVIGGTPATSWQADVKQRYTTTGTHVKHSVISFIVPSLTASSTVTVTFQNATCSNTALTKAQMQDAAYDFNAQMLLTNGSTLTADARTMLNDGAYTLWTSGQVAQTIILADHSQGTTCNGHACGAYDIGFDANKSFRPIFHATFWPAIHKVTVRFVGEIANTETLQDQTYSLVLKTGNASPTQVYGKASFTHYAQSRWTKQYWIGGAPGTISINHNVAYLAATKAIVNFDPARTISGGTLTSAYATWTSAAKDLYDAGEYDKDTSGGGYHAWVGPYPEWTVRWLYTGDYRMKEEAFGNADLAGAWPIHVREGKPTGKVFERTGSTNAVGRVWSINSRPSSCFIGGLTDGNSGDKVTPVGTRTAGGWVVDAAHLGDFVTPQYLLTGDYWYLEEAMFWGSWDVAENPNSQWERAGTGVYGVCSHQQPGRGTGWTLYIRDNVWSVMPDGTPEQTYFATMIGDCIAGEEGMRNITGTSYETHPAWTAMRAIATDVDFMNTPGLPAPLHQWLGGNTNFVQPEYGINSSVTKWAHSLFESHFDVLALGRAKELGFAANTILTWASTFYNGGLTDSNYNPRLMFNGRYPTYRTSDGQAFPNWAALKTGYDSTWQALSSGYFAPGYGYSGPPTGYQSQLMAAVSFTSAETNGTAAWSWIATNVASDSAFNNNPIWALLPRSAPAPVAPTITTTSPLTSGTVGVAYSLQFTATGDTPITWTYDAVPGGLTFTSGGLLSGTPTTVGTSIINVTATNAAGSAGPTGFSLTRGAAGVYGQATGRMTGTIK